MVDPRKLDLLKRLEPLQAVVKTFRRDTAFVIRVPVTVWPEVLDEELGLDGLLTRRFWLERPPVPCSSPPKEKKPDIPADARRLLVLLSTKTGYTAMEYFQELGLSAATGSRIKKKLEEMGLIRSHALAGGRRGGSIQAIELLPVGCERLGLSVQPQEVKGSYCHRWWAHRVKRWLETKGHE